MAAAVRPSPRRPAAVAPMLATVGAGLPPGDDGRWVFEPKYDGIRIIAYASPERAALFSRNALEKTRQFPEVVEGLRALSARVRRPFVMDGEIVALSGTGKGTSPARFQELQSRMHVTDQRAIEGLREQAPAALVAFDLLLDGQDSLVDEPWTARREALEALFPRRASEAVRLTDVSTDGERMLDTARREGWEGIIAKRADAPYRPGARSRDWLKLKLERRQELVVGGYTEPRNSREHIGAVLLGYYDDEGRLVYAGHTGGGFSRATLADMAKRLRRLERRTSPFTTTPRTNERPHWVRPEVVVEVKFNEWTAEGKLRQPIFVGVREDKDAREVVREPESLVDAAPRKSTTTKRASTRGTKTGAAKGRGTSGTSGAGGGAKRSRAGGGAAKRADAVVERLLEIEHEEGGDGVLELDTGTLQLSNLGKIYFPGAKKTKGDLMRYYARMSPYILPAIEGRALVMRRFPNGIKGKAFYQQKAPPTAPASVRIEKVADEGIETQPRLVGGDMATLLYLVQLGAVSVDPWHSRVDTVQHADYTIIDLDPGPRATFKRVIEVARRTKDVLDRLGLHAVPKTSGATGLHVYMPLGRDVPNDAARMVAELVATTVAEELPKSATVRRIVRSRPATSVYVDYLQNIRGKTVAGVYSARARPGATVSTPLTWDEVEPSLDPRDFTIDTVPPRVQEVGDLWAAGMRKPNRLDRLLSR